MSDTSSTFSAKPPDQPKTAQAGFQESNSIRNEDGTLKLNPAGRVIDRPDLIRDKEIAAEQADKAASRDPGQPLNEGGIYTFVPPGGNGAGLTMTVRNGGLVVTMTPDKGLPVAVTISGVDLDRLRAALR